jgi:Stress responsive A/B Barrel Domain
VFTLGRHESEEKLSEYLNDPEHRKVVKRVLEICDEILPVDWISTEGLVPGPVTPGSAIRVALVKLKEGNSLFNLE